MLEEFVQEQKRLLNLEKNYEISTLSEQLQLFSPTECEEMGLSIVRLKVIDLSTGLFGRVNLSLKKSEKVRLPNVFKVGEEVVVVDQSDKKISFSGAVVLASESELIVTLDDCEVTYDLIPAVVRVDRRYSEATHLKMMRCLDAMKSRSNRLLDIMYRSVDPGIAMANVIEKTEKYFDKNLNDSQKIAVNLALSSPVFAVVHGPPGTGKTSTVSEIIQQFIARGKRVLVTAPSNIAVDNVLDRLARSGNKKIQPVRVGHPTRIHTSVLDFCLEALIARDEGTEIVSDVKQDIAKLQQQLKKKQPSAVKSEMRRELRQLRQELKSRERNVVKNIILKSNVVCGTCIGVDSSLLRDQEFDVAIIDEAAQALEAASWIPILKATKVIFAGDHCQLPATVKCPEAEQDGLAVSLFEKLIERSFFQPQVQLLNTQYRMHDRICNWASEVMYKGQLRSDESAATRALDGLLSGKAYSVLTLVDTSGCCMDEKKTIRGSYSNEHEADIVKKYILILLQHGLPPHAIGVITPYSGQVEAIKEAFAHDADPSISELTSKIEVRTVDGFQGGEKECIVLSLVRSNSDHEVGFLGENRRINVAITRAKRHIAVIADVETCSTDPFLGVLLQYFSHNGDHRSGSEFLDDDWKSLDFCVESDLGSSAATNLVSVSTMRNLEKNVVSEAKKEIVLNKPLSDTKTPKKSTKESGLSKPPKEVSRPPKEASIAEPFDKKLLDKATVVPITVTEVVNFEKQVESLFHGLFECHELSHYQEQWMIEQQIQYIPGGKVIFPSSLTGNQRKYVHELCEAFNIGHQSFSNGSQRWIEVFWKDHNNNNNTTLSTMSQKGVAASNIVIAAAAAPTTITSSTTTSCSDRSSGDYDDDDSDNNKSHSNSQSSSNSDNHSHSNKNPVAMKKAPETNVVSMVVPENNNSNNVKGRSPIHGQTESNSTSIPAKTETSSYRPKEKKGKQSAKVEMTEEEMLEQCRLENERKAYELRYRVPAKPMPKPEIERSRSNLHAVLAAAQQNRRSKDAVPKKKK